MENELIKLKEQHADFIASLSDDYKAKIDACTTVEELRALIDEYDGELPDDVVEAVAGGKGEHECVFHAVKEGGVSRGGTVPSGVLVRKIEYKILQCNICGKYEYLFSGELCSSWERFHTLFLQHESDDSEILPYKPSDK